MEVWVQFFLEIIGAISASPNQVDLFYITMVQKIDSNFTAQQHFNLRKIFGCEQIIIIQGI